ncbi:DnaJ domain-containing protein [Sphingomonas sp.]|jgi:DnaJ-domain-containing protein 1|uniref:DnaJ domain-containing protein n=1 Tax=Sphingomonas sp. TaxID=28214 RepID=UPI002D7F7682|nr:DnaJ domain-containing protein [Sphingomonas sp.]HEU0045457.1 DnaJ domain-containing protein [Sphingomonas sp.]
MIKAVVVLLAIVGAWLLLRAAMRQRRATTPTLTILTEREARAVLGVSPDADAETIRAAHRRLVAGVHPDTGGSDELARRVNAARDVLLKDQN